MNIKQAFRNYIGKQAKDISALYNSEDIVSDLNTITPIFDDNKVCVGVRTFTRSNNDEPFKVFDNFKNEVIETQDMLIFATPNVSNKIASVCCIEPDLKTFLKVRYEYPTMILQSQLEYYTEVNPTSYSNIKEMDYIPKWLSSKVDNLFEGRLQNHINNFILQGNLSKSKLVWRNREYVFARFHDNDIDYIEQIIRSKLVDVVNLLEANSAEEVIKIMNNSDIPTSKVYGVLKGSTNSDILNFISDITNDYLSNGIKVFYQWRWNKDNNRWEKEI